ncbi:flagellar export protein FliJ [Motiliproteus coralliicola]|uniref:Flagellar FliJ protein n=1 Tax=Motiliproteus coralliicola TaxID=2283196 RepID=A0A369WPB9_9GAMM|nr:flagellar export protein FliJ [Motiliproteus coralliicola]RDE22416.1 flagellar export protein FliJ [Motiliproteus coralliicola]
MKRSKRLRPVQHLAERRRKEAEQQLGAAQQQLLAEQQKLVQLEQYLADYQQSLLQTGRDGVAIDQLQRLQSFKHRLLDALAQQRRQIEFCRQLLDRAKQTWHQASGRERAMESLIDRAAQQEARDEEKLLQKQIDELAQSRRSRPRVDG